MVHFTNVNNNSFLTTKHVFKCTVVSNVHTLEVYRNYAILPYFVFLCTDTLIAIKMETPMHLVLRSL